MINISRDIINSIATWMQGWGIDMNSLTSMKMKSARGEHYERKTRLKNLSKQNLGKTLMKNQIARFFLLLAATGWGISFIFTFSSWTTGVGILYNMGAQPIDYQPMLDYWLKMASSVFGCLGIIYLKCFFKPGENENTIRLLSFLALFVGITLLISAWTNKLTYPHHPTFPVDIMFCFSTGLGGLLYRRT